MRTVRILTVAHQLARSMKGVVVVKSFACFGMTVGTSRTGTAVSCSLGGERTEVFAKTNHFLKWLELVAGRVLVLGACMELVLGVSRHSSTLVRTVKATPGKQAGLE